MDWRLSFSLLLALSVLVHNLEGCLCLNSEGLALLRFRERIERDPYGALLDWNVDDDDPCSWFGVGCLDGKVVLLNLKDLCLEGTLAAELGTLRHIRSIILRNNSFSGIIPREVGQLKELEVLDLAYNNLSGPVPSGFGSNSSLKILTLSNNFYLDSISPELHELNMRSELYVGQNVLSDVVRKASWIGRSIMRYINGQVEDAGNRRLLQSTLAASPAAFPTPSPPSSVSQSSSSIALPPSPSGDSPVPAPSPTVDPPFPVPTKPNIAVDAPPSLSVPSPSPSISPQQSQRARSSHNFLWIVSLSIIVGVCVVFIISIFGILFWKNKKVVTVRPWTTGLSGQLQKAFVTGVPSLKRSELETACEDFSNIIGTLSDSTVYKGTLSSGVEIAVVVCALTSAKDWSKHLEEQFRKKIDTLSKVNHKNFVNLLGYCEEEQPFARMMVFEYAPNGTLFEHLHIKEAEHLDWGMRLRIAMGMAYCLEHMHQLDPPIFLKNLNSTTVYLTDDYAAKISDFSLWNKTAVLKIRSEDTVSSDSLLGAQSNVYSFGLILLEMITGKLSDSEYDGPLIELSSEHLRGLRPLREIMDPMLLSVKEDEANSLCSVILSCTNPDPTQRPTMREVTARLREITAMAPDGATPRLSPLWWAELEILSSDAS